jgi:hypothetical protein
MFERSRGALLLASALLLGACAGSMGAGGGRAQAEFDAGHWEQAAVQFAAVIQDPSVTEEARHTAELRLAISLHRLGLRGVGAALLKTIAGRPEHTLRKEAFQALLPLALDLPSAAGVEVPLLQFDYEGRELMIAGLAPAAESRIRYIIGRFEYENADYEKAIAQLEKAKDADLARAQILIAHCHVRLHKSVPASKALEGALTAAAKLPAPESARLTDQANMLMAQLFYSAALAKSKKDDSLVAVNTQQASAALKYWKKIDASSPLGTEALWQRAWVEMAMGEHKTALDDVKSAIAAPGAYVPEAEQMEATLRWGLGEKPAALDAFRAFVKKYTAVHTALKEQIDRLGKEKDPDEAFFALLARASAKPDELPQATKLAILHALRDRQVLAYVEYSEILDEDRDRLESLSALQSGGAASSARRALEAERKALVDRAAKVVRARLTREAEEIQGLLKEAETALASGGP